ncbi:sugar phosphate isomerase/epimerase family protein [Haematomicrobium sanguinis]|uniref:sugar phosphate isomerase/epimerase family protein n=1 Tax=Haematomicrobium sanguinis TaxID=479106 RepID=UPI00047C73E2|nr:sugar phosphate isomerase/epimerase [Haematomicrobium sanguinis]
MKLSLQLYTLRNQIDEDLPGTLDRVAELGFTNVEPYGFADRAPEMAAALNERGLMAPSGHAPLISGDAEAILEAAATLGMTTVIDPHRPQELWENVADIQAAAARLNEIAPLAAERGIRIGYHNHNWELEKKYDGDASSTGRLAETGETTALEYFASLLDPSIVLEVDVYWALVGGVDPVALLERLGDRVKFLHLKDGPATGVTKDQLPAGDGEVPLKDIVETSGAEYGVVEFDDYSGDIFEGIAESKEYLVKAGVEGK